MIAGKVPRCATRLAENGYVVDGIATRAARLGKIVVVVVRRLWVQSKLVEAT